MNTKIVTEDEFLQLICEKSGIKNPTYENNDCEMMPESDEEEKVVPEVKKELNEDIDFIDKKTVKSKEQSESISFLDKEKVKVKKMEMSESIDFLDSKAKVKKEVKEEPVVTPKTEVSKEVQVSKVALLLIAIRK